MSLFDVIKYPISDIPTEELDRLPDDLYAKWLIECGLRHRYKREVVDYLLYFYRTSDVELFVTRLRKRIERY